MKRKILSLALALMMIISVVAAMPVSAEVADIVIPGDSFTSMGTAAANGNGGVWKRDEGAAEYWSAGSKTPAYADYTLNVDTEGYYKVSVTITNAYNVSVYSHQTAGLAAATTITIDGTEYHGRYPAFDATTEITRVYLTAGEHNLRVSEIAGARYNLNNITFSYDDDVQAPAETIFIEPYSGSSTGGSRALFWEYHPGAGSCDWATPSQFGFYMGSTSANCNLTMNFVSDESAYYDVYIASASTTAATMTCTIGSESVTNVLPGAKSDGPAYETNFGRIYIDKGPNSIYLVGSIGSTTKYIYNVKLVKSADQTPPSEFIISAAKPSSYSVGSNGEQNRVDFGISNNICGWATTGATKIANETDWYEYDVRAFTAGYYDMAIAAGTLAPNCKMTIDVNGVRYANASNLTWPNNSSSVSVVDDTDFGKVYLKAGINKVRVQGTADSGAYYFYDIKLSLTSSPAENEIRILDGYNAETATFDAGTGAYAEVHTSSDVKVFIVNYEDLGDGLMKMTGYSEGETVFTGDGFKIVRTTAPLSTSEGIVKAFVWANGTFAPIDLATATVNPAPEAE